MAPAGVRLLGMQVHQPTSIPVHCHVHTGAPGRSCQRRAL